ncbi:MAG: hypothetical protein DRO00_05615 [Thermoproteota archaeon]|nr:MAG: hypothetical protein DRO00_05615 [Candidatus Korarchaeota archaeon]
MVGTYVEVLLDWMTEPLEKRPTNLIQNDYFDMVRTEGHLPEDLANFLGAVTLVEEKDLMELFERGLDLSVPERIQG